MNHSVINIEPLIMPKAYNNISYQNIQIKARFSSDHKDS